MNKKSTSLLPYFFAIIVDILGYGLVYPLVAAIFAGEHTAFWGPWISKDLHNFYLGIIFALYPLCMFFGASFISDIADIIGRKKVLICTMLLLAISFWIMGTGVDMSSFSLFLLGRGLSGIAAGSQPVAQTSISEMSNVTVKARNMTTLAAAQAVGLILGPLIAGFFSDGKISSSFTYSLPFFIGAGLALLSAIWMLMASNKSSYRVVREKKIDILRPIYMFIDAFRYRSVRLLSFSFLLLQIAFGTYFQLISIFLKDTFNYTSWEIGLFYAFIGVCFPIGLLFVRMLHTQISIATMTLWGLIAFTASLVVASFTFSHVLVWIAGFLFALTDMIAYVGMVSCFAHAVERRRQTWAMGVFGSLIAVGFIISGLCPNMLDSLMTHGVMITAAAIAFLSWVTLALHLKVR